MGEVIVNLIGLMITASLVNNVVLSQFLGLCPFLGVSKKTDTALGMGAACIFVITMASLVCSIIYKFILDPLDLSYLNRVYPCYRHAGSVCRDDPQEVRGISLPGSWSLSSSYHNKLRSTWCGT